MTTMQPITRNQVLAAFGPVAAHLFDAGIVPDAAALAARLSAGAGRNRRREAAGRRYKARVKAMELAERRAA